MAEGARLESDSGELHRVTLDTSSRNRFNDFPLQNACWCEPVNIGVSGQLSRRPYTVSTQFLAALLRVLPDARR